ncbi:MAG: formyltetrahydrofolate deformylase [Candidatus Competibacteraceae bacterium]|nr:formyltetrahydrofolate deformylase [Candidatus Competibacteraceae bacterium]
MSALPVVPIVENQNLYILKVACIQARGQVAAISGFLDQRGCYITEFVQFEDDFTGRFFVRTVFRSESDHTLSLERLRLEFETLAVRFDMDWSLHDAATPARVLILVSKFDHCLQDLLYRYRTGELPMEVATVVSNHPDLEPLSQGYGIPFIHLPVSSTTRVEQESRLWQIIQETQSDLVVLARYMQILSDDLCTKLQGRAINIHHSFLPGFKGAKPYHQAFARGVKLIGATAHYVTPDLDEGPIIEQVVERVDHTYRPEQLVAAGRDSEKLALARAVKFHIERRVFMNGNKTIILR